MRDHRLRSAALSITDAERERSCRPLAPTEQSFTAPGPAFETGRSFRCQHYRMGRLPRTEFPLASVGKEPYSTG